LRTVIVLALILLGGSVPNLEAQNFCDSSLDGTATIELTSPPFGGFHALIKLSEFYGSGAALGAPQVVVTGNRIEISQSNSVYWPLPTLTCREQTLDVGPLSPGRYDVTWTTIEELSPPLNPPTRTRIRTFAFVISPMEAIPAADRYVLLLLGLTLVGIGVTRFARA
jgi:hypothetical protein